MAFFCVSH
ncbi:hypothetical protein VCCP10303_1575, partial [Vibrio cholerae CP1030(3)]